jgi:Fe-S cluster assembly protein SufD
VVVGQDANVTTLNAEVGSKVSKVGLDVQMTGKGGTSRLLGLLAAGGDQHIDINSDQDLRASYTTSDLLYLSALYDRSRAAFYGVTKVRSEAKQTSSYQECRNLLLSPQAGAEPIPVLEIETNDILRCGHGATAGAIDPVQLFYAGTRGLDAATAERMIVRGFFEQVVSQIHNETIRARVLEALAARIGTEEELVA